VWDVVARRFICGAALLLLFMSAAASPGLACDFGLLISPITDTSRTYIRRGNGEWGAARKDGGQHGGVDLVANASFAEKGAYSVFPAGPGNVAYSRLNGTSATGYGNVVVVDHGHNCYTLYAHLAEGPFVPLKPGGNLLVKVGDAVTSTTVLGYFVDIRADVDSTGNARSTSPEARHQVHFEVISAPSGRRGSGSLLATILKEDGRRLDPTPVLLRMGYAVK